MKIIPFYIGAGLLFISAGRFWANGDFIGAVIAAITACLALSWTYNHFRNLRVSMK